MLTKQQKTRREELSDIGRVLGALVGNSFNTEPDQVVKVYLDQDAKHLREDLQPIRIELERLPPLVLEPGSPVLIGGGGIVFRVAHGEIQRIHYALKIPRPSVFEHTDPAAEYALAQTEYLQHAPISHKNVAQVFGAGKLKLPLRGLPVVFDPILMEWIDRPLPLCTYLAQLAATHEDVLALLVQAFEALEAIHSRQLIHWDIKSDNLLVDRHGTLKLTDLGNSRRYSDSSRNHKAFSTIWNIPPTLRKAGKIEPKRLKGSARRLPIPLPRLEWDSPWLDLWMLGREMNRLVRAVPEILADDIAVKLPKEQVPDSSRFLARCFPKENEVAQFVLRCLQLIVRRLLYPMEPSSARFYDSAAEVAGSLQRILPDLGDADSIPELQVIPQHVLRLPRSGNAPFTARVSALFNSTPIQRLARHSQLGTVSHVYPGGSHRRSEHVAGVFSATGHYVRALYADLDNPFWRIMIERSDVEALLVAALTHDIGHMAFGHYLEDMDGLFSGRKHEDYVIAVLAPDRASAEVSESSTAVAATQRDREALLSSLSGGWGTRSEAESLLGKAAEILKPMPGGFPAREEESQLQKQPSRQLKMEILHSILDSAIDADKLDYLLRDAHHCGVQYAQGIDLDRFFQTLTTLPLIRRDSEPVHACIGVSPKGVLPLESLLIARYQMFSCVYWHHTSRAETAMLQLAVEEFIAGGGESAAGTRLDQLMQVFREKSDDEALNWLRVELAGRRTKTKVPAQALHLICTALIGDRQHLFRRAFEIRYGDKESSDALSALQEKLVGINGATSPHDYVLRARAFRELFTNAVSDELPTRVALTYGELLVDIPPAGKDQVENVFISDQGRPRTIQEASPVAEAVRSSFASWARPARVFIVRTAAERLRADGVEIEQLTAAIRSTLRSQRRLFEDT